MGVATWLFIVQLVLGLKVTQINSISTKLSEDDDSERTALYSSTANATRSPRASNFVTLHSIAVTPPWSILRTSLNELSFTSITSLTASHQKPIISSKHTSMEKNNITKIDALPTSNKPTMKDTLVLSHGPSTTMTSTNTTRNTGFPFTRQVSSSAQYIYTNIKYATRTELSAQFITASLISQPSLLSENTYRTTQKIITTLSVRNPSAKNSVVPCTTLSASVFSQNGKQPSCSEQTSFTTSPSKIQLSITPTLPALSHTQTTERYSTSKSYFINERSSSPSHQLTAQLELSTASLVMSRPASSSFNQTDNNSKETSNKKGLPTYLYIVMAALGVSLLSIITVLTIFGVQRFRSNQRTKFLKRQITASMYDYMHKSRSNTGDFSYEYSSDITDDHKRTQPNGDTAIELETFSEMYQNPVAYRTFHNRKKAGRHGDANPENEHHAVESEDLSGSYPDDDVAITRLRTYSKL